LPLSKAKQAEEEDAEAGEKRSQPDLRAYETPSDKPERTEASLKKPACDLGMSWPSVEETGAGPASKLRTPDPPESVQMN
jgi:hypothetical protein